MLHYRALFEQLIGETRSDVAGRTYVPADVPRVNEVSTATDRGALTREEALRADRDRDFR
jgi:hypothetical protein